jgi:hypothetical protein
MKYFIFVLLFVCSSFSFAGSLSKGEVYRTMVNIEVGDSIDFPTGIKVGANSKFLVIDDKDEKVYSVKFKKIYQYGDLEINPTKNHYKNFKPSGVIEDRIYYVGKNIGDKNAISLADAVVKSFAGIVSGPLIVPFKYRLDDKSISGEAMIGYYAGISFDMGESEYNVGITPFLSAGLSQISVNSVTDDGLVDADSKTGFTWSAGLLIRNWDAVNIGLVYGRDRIGDSTWEHEGEGWFSISVGWKI